MTAPAPRRVRYRYLFTDIRSGRLKGSLPLAGASFDDALGGSADGAGEVSLRDPAVRDLDVYDVTAQRRTALWVLREEWDPRRRAVVGLTVPWGGVVMRRQRSLLGRSLSITAITWAAYFARRHTPDLTFTGADKLDVARALVASGTPQRGAAYPPVSPHHVGIADGTSLSGQTVDRSYLLSDRKPVLDNLSELAGSAPAFDWHLTPYLRTPGDLSTLAVRLDTGYPRLGRTAPPGITWRTPESQADRGRAGFLLGGNLVEDGSAADNELTGLGSGSGPTQLRATVTADQAGIPELEAGYPLYQGLLRSATPDLRTQAALSSHVTGMVRATLAAEVKVSGVSVRGDLHPALPLYEVGDDATLDLAEGIDGQPTVIIGQIVSRKITPPESGRTETVDFDLQGTATVLLP